MNRLQLMGPHYHPSGSQRGSHAFPLAKNHRTDVSHLNAMLVHVVILLPDTSHHTPLLLGHALHPHTIRVPTNHRVPCMVVYPGIMHTYCKHTMALSHSRKEEAESSISHRINTEQRRARGACSRLQVLHPSTDLAPSYSQGLLESQNTHALTTSDHTHVALYCRHKAHVGARHLLQCQPLPLQPPVLTVSLPCQSCLEKNLPVR